MLFRSSKIGKRKRESIPKEQSSRKKAKTSQLAANQNDSATQLESENDGDKSDEETYIDGVDWMPVDVDNQIMAANVNRSSATTINSGNTIQDTPLIPPLAGMTKDEYEFRVMDIYINAKTREVCRRRVCNEYFGNDEGRANVTIHIDLYTNV